MNLTSKQLKSMAMQYLTNAHGHLGEQSYASVWLGTLTVTEWCKAIGEARDIIFAAFLDVEAAAPPVLTDEYVIEIERRNGWGRSRIYSSVYSYDAAKKIVGNNANLNIYRVTPLTKPVKVPKLVDGDVWTSRKAVEASPKPAPTPLEKAVVETGFSSAGKFYVVIDGAKLEREVLKASIKDGDVQKLLPFQTTLGRGNNYTHIVNTSSYDVETNYHVIGEGETICKRHGGEESLWAIGTAVTPLCPGCIAKAKAIIVAHLFNSPNIVR
jgi:hypothetical protein